VVIALNRDRFVAEFKGRPPVCTYRERREVLEACVYVDEVVENAGDQDSTVTIEQVQPDFILIGDDWAQRDYYKQMNFTPTWLDERGITLLYVPRQRKISSTMIKERTNGQLGTRPLPT
jgi:glycerol-3-phosphate cytidylyltransferase